jgi:hypothetical protein
MCNAACCAVAGLGFMFAAGWRVSHSACISHTQRLVGEAEFVDARA